MPPLPAPERPLVKGPGDDERGRQYREAKASIATHRARQAAAEVELGRLLRARQSNGRPSRYEAAVVEARERVDRAHADVDWCKAVTVAAGEAFKGVRLDEVPQGGDR